MQASLYRLSEEGSYALTLRAAARSTAQRTATHFIMLIDTSDSMSDGDKLATVKHSASLVLHFLGPQDRLSILTFGDDADIHANAVACTPAQKGQLQMRLDRIQTDGCTNLSAGLIALKQILSQRTEAVASLKTGILLLTDGHANRGVSRAEQLRTLVGSFQEEWSECSWQFVAYGTDHNAELLKTLAEDMRGAYSIVDTKEGAASVIGDSLGSLFSCVAQQVRVRFSQGQVQVEGTLRADGSLFLGDMYEENEMIVLFRVEGGTPCALEISGTRIPSLEPVHIALNTVSALTVLPEGLQAAVAFTRIRYAIAALFKKTREYRLGSSRFQEVEVEVARLEQELRELQNGSQEQTVATALLAECAAIREAVTAYQMGTRADAMDLTSRILAHEATMGLGRGTVQSLSRPRPSASSEEEDPQNASMTRRVPDITSPYQSRTARRVTRLMATMSSGGAGYEEAVHEAQTLSQMP